MTDEVEELLRDCLDYFVDERREFGLEDDLIARLVRVLQR